MAELIIPACGLIGFVIGFIGVTLILNRIWK